MFLPILHFIFYTISKTKINNSSLSGCYYVCGGGGGSAYGVWSLLHIDYDGCGTWHVSHTSFTVVTSLIISDGH